jgi:hypothetical protein
VKKSNLLLLLLVAALLGYLVWTQVAARREAENKLGLDASRIVSVQFTDRAEVKVGELTGQVTARGTDKGFMGILSSETVAVLPFAVDYHIDVSGLGAGAYRWDQESKTLTIDVPDVIAGKPNIDEAKARVQQKGVFISRRAAQDLTRQVSQRAEARSAQEAQRPEHLNKARENARAVLTNMAQGPLTAAGIDDVRVAVRFPWEPKSTGSHGEQMDRSRRVEDVLEERNAQTR